MTHATVMPAPGGTSNTLGGYDPLDALSHLERAMFGYLADYDGLTRRLYEHHLTTYARWCLEHGIDAMAADRTHIALYVRHCHEILGHKASTVSTELTPVRGFYKWCFLEGLVDRDPAAHVRLPKVHLEQKQPLTKDELREIRAAGKDLGGRHWALSELLIVHALRISEAAGLRIEDYQDTERGHRVMRFTRKGGRRATIPLPVPVLMALDAAADDRTQGPVIASQTGAQLTRSGATSLLHTIVKRTSITRTVHPHLIRGSVITDGLEDGLSLREAQWLAGHSDPRVTSRHYDLGKLNHARNPVHVVSARLTA